MTPRTIAAQPRTRYSATSRIRTAAARSATERRAQQPTGTTGLSRSQAIQGGLGDAWLIAVLGAVASHRPEAILDVLHRPGPGTVQVRLHEARPELATADWTPTGRRLSLAISDDLTPMPYANQPNTAYADSYHTGAIWPALLEKAFAAIDTTWSRIRRFTIPNRGYTRLDQPASPYDTAEALTQLTGLRAGILHLHHHTTHTTLRYLLTHHRPVIITTREPASPTTAPVHGTYPGHTYEITTINPDHTLRLHNPWGALHVPNLPITALFHLTGGVITTLKD